MKTATSCLQFTWGLVQTRPSVTGAAIWDMCDIHHCHFQRENKVPRLAGFTEHIWDTRISLLWSISWMIFFIDVDFFLKRGKNGLNGMFQIKIYLSLFTLDSLSQIKICSYILETVKVLEATEFALERKDNENTYKSRCHQHKSGREFIELLAPSSDLKSGLTLGILNDSFTGRLCLTERRWTWVNIPWYLLCWLGSRVLCHIHHYLLTKAEAIRNVSVGVKWQQHLSGRQRAGAGMGSF